MSADPSAGAARSPVLPGGVIEVDEAGIVLDCGAEAARLFGIVPDAMIGRDFFRDVAPATHVPAFHGRFLAGVRSGQFETSFGFVLSVDPQPLRLAVTLRSDGRTGRCHLMLETLGPVAPTRQRTFAELAAAAVERRVRAEPIDPSICEREPIHLPGAVQPHVAMLALDPASLTVAACSDNAGERFGRSVEALLGLDVADLLPAAIVASLSEVATGQRASDPARPFRARVPLRGEVHELTAHLHGGLLVVELELLPDAPGDFEAATPLHAQDAISRLRDAPDLVTAARACVEDVRAMTGFERVLVYRFDAEWNGEAIAESVAASWGDSLLGLRFPASDIPAQARSLYTRAPARFVVDRDASPAPLLAAPETGNRPIDLSFTHARALSPIHLEYQRNLGVNGSMSASIVVDQALWGLVIGHHRLPHYVDPETRALATLVSEAFALRVHELESHALWQARQAHFATQQMLFEQMARSDDYVAALLTEHALLDDLFASDGAAVIVDGHIRAIGHAPAVPVIETVAAWLRHGPLATARSYVTDALPEAYPDADDLRELASGLLAVAIDPAGRHLLIWFRGEAAATVAWGGDPSKPVLGDASAQIVLPRRSFERWVEERRGRSLPWTGWEASAAEAFAAGIEGVILRQARRIHTLTEKQAALTAALAQKDVLAREVDHRVKNSLQIVAAVMLMQARKVDEPTARAALEETYARVMSVARVHDSLQQTDDMENVEIGETLRELCNDLLGGMAGAGLSVEVTSEGRVMVSSRTAVALSLIATELVTNAVKYAYAPGEKGEVAIHVAPRGEGLTLRICDNGRGLPSDWEETAERRGSGGLGMRIIKAMLQQIDARMEVGSADPTGACFTVHA